MPASSLLVTEDGELGVLLGVAEARCRRVVAVGPQRGLSAATTGAARRVPAGPPSRRAAYPPIDQPSRPIRLTSQPAPAQQRHELVEHHRAGVLAVRPSVPVRRAAVDRGDRERRHAVARRRPRGSGRGRDAGSSPSGGRCRGRAARRAPGAPSCRRAGRRSRSPCALPRGPSRRTRPRPRSRAARREPGRARRSDRASLDPGTAGISPFSTPTAATASPPAPRPSPPSSSARRDGRPVTSVLDPRERLGFLELVGDLEEPAVVALRRGELYADRQSRRAWCPSAARSPGRRSRSAAA